MDDIKLIQLYIQDINKALKDVQSQDVLDLFKELYDKEQAFAAELRSTKAGRDVYLKFIRDISDAQGGMKKARSYFRIRENMYKTTVNRAIREIKPELIFNVPINFRLCSFAITNFTGNTKKLAPLFEEIKSLRDQIISRHLYLSLHKAKVFTKNFYNSSVDFEDLVQVANEALVVAVDKYVMGDDSSSFHSMAIGRMIADLISNGSFASSVTIGGHAQKKLYRIRKILQNNPNINSREMSAALDIAEEEINDLMGATVYKSFSDPVGADGDMTFGDLLLESPDEKITNQESLVIDQNLKDVLKEAYGVLSVVQRKILILKGINLK